MKARSSAISLIVNRHAGRFRTPPSVDELVAILTRYGLRPEPILIEKGQDPGEAARAALRRGAQTLVAAGGDGTISSVAAALVDSEAILGVLPIGTLNHFAKDLRIPVDIERAATVLAKGRVAKIDVGEVNGRVFINNSGIGVYPRMVKWREEYRRMGATQLTALFWAAVTAARRMPFLRLRLTADGTDVTLVTPLIFIGNNEYEVAGFTSGRRRRVDAGQLFLCAVHATTPTRLMRLSLMALLGRLRQDDDFHSVCVAEAWIETRQLWVRVSLDGEVVRLATPLHYRARPGALRVLVPQEEIVSEP
ncbi:MAG: diacylglycerol kinase family protein [Bryobacteraceae bacterium]